MNTEFTVTQKRALAVATVLALLFVAYFLRSYFILIVVAAVAAYLFAPLYDRLRKRFGPGLSATITLLAVLNEALARVPLMHDVQLTPDLLRERMSTLAQHVGEYLLGFLQGAAGGLV